MLCLEAPPTKEVSKTLEATTATTTKATTTTEAPTITEVTTTTETSSTDLPPTESSQPPVIISEAPLNLNESLPIGPDLELSGDFDETIETPEHQMSTPVYSQPEDDSFAPSPLVIKESDKVGCVFTLYYLMQNSD